MEDHKYPVEQVTVETETNSLPEVQKQFAPTLEYDDGLYSGTLTFDSTAILTEPSGYTSQSRTITDTKTIGPLDRNDMSYVPSTSVKDGVTLKLSNVDWQIIGTDVAGDSQIRSPGSLSGILYKNGISAMRTRTIWIPLLWSATGGMGSPSTMRL